MELNEFVKETLVQIAEGVKKAIDATDGEGFSINPAKDMKADVEVIKFNVLVETSSKGGMNIKIAEAGCSTNNVNRIEFEVKMTLPCTNDLRYSTEAPKRIIPSS